MADGVVCGAECASDPGGITALSSFMPVGFGSAVTAAFAAWSAVADITFTMVADGGEPFGAPGPADIRLGGHTFDGPSGVLAHGFFPPVNGVTAAGDIHFDIAEAWVLGFAGPGFDIFQVLAHEIGHAIGLGHTSVVDSLMNGPYSEAFSGLQADDIAGAVHLYGAPVVGPGPNPNPNPVDEPYTLILMLSGFALLLRRKSKFSA